MMPKSFRNNHYILPLILLAVTLAISGGASVIRRDLPVEIEFVNRGNRITVINTLSWDKKNYDIRMHDDRGNSRNLVLSGIKKEISIDNIMQGSNYTFLVSRNDVLGKIRYRTREYQNLAMNKPYVVLVGASIGKAWMFPGIPGRVNRKDMDFGYRFGAQGFDKEDVLTDILSLDTIPDIILIKECAAYFPRDQKESMDKIIEWVNNLKKGNIVPVLATTVPVTLANDRLFPGRQDSINVFNSGIREYASRYNIAVLDLQEMLEDKSGGRYLRDEYALDDGLHLNKEAYRVLDQAAMSVVSGVMKSDG